MCYAVALDGTVPMCYASPSELHSGTVARWHGGTVAQWLEGGPEGRRAGWAGGQGGQEGRRAGGQCAAGSPSAGARCPKTPPSAQSGPRWQTPGRPNVEGLLKNILGFCQNSGEGPRKYFGILPLWHFDTPHLLVIFVTWKTHVYAHAARQPWDQTSQPPPSTVAPGVRTGPAKTGAGAAKRESVEGPSHVVSARPTSPTYISAPSTVRRAGIARARGSCVRKRRSSLWAVPAVIAPLSSARSRGSCTRSLRTSTTRTQRRRRATPVA